MATTTSKTSQIISKFSEVVNREQEYTSKDLQKVIDSVYKEVYGGRKRVTTAGGEKKAPSAYNLFIKSEIEKIKAEKLPGVDPKDYMKIAAQRWKENKGK